MSHEVIQVIKLVKYNRKSHEMITLICKCIPTSVNKKNAQERTLTWNDAVSEPNHHLVFTTRTGTDLQIISWIGLRISYVSGPQRARIRIGSGSPTTVRISPNGSKTLSHATEHTNKYKYTLNTLLSTPTHTCTPTHVHIQVYTYIHTICIHTDW